jgi:molybdopterin/thiamine biosynthesis adenylyltransferase
VLLLGAGGLGSPAALYLAAAGVGTLGLVDGDVVDASNLQRQILHATSRVGTPKVDSAEIGLHDLNPDVKIIKFQERLTSENVDRIFGSSTSSSTAATTSPPATSSTTPRCFMKKPCGPRLGLPLRGPGHHVRALQGGPCYRCLYPEPPPPHLAPSCQEAGVLGILPGVIGVIQATEAIKLLLGKGNPLNGRLLTYDSLR